MGIDSLLHHSSSNQTLDLWCLDVLNSVRVSNETTKIIAPSLGALGSRALENLKKAHEGCKDKTMSRNDALLLIQDSMNYVCTSMNSTLYSADHAFISKMDKDVSQTSKLKLLAAPFNTETPFAD